VIGAGPCRNDESRAIVRDMDEPTQILITRAQASDQAATGLLFERYQRRVRGALGRMVAGQRLPPGHDTDDLLQDAMLAALRGLQGFEYRGEGSFLAWLLQTARNELLQRLRAGNRKKRAGNHETWSRVGEPVNDDATPSQVAIGNELEDRVQACIEQLPDNQRTIIMLARYLDCSAAEIAEKMELPSQGAARAMLMRAQARLVRLLDTPPEDDA